MADLQVHEHLDRGLLDEIRALVDAVAAADGQAPLGEHKAVQLALGAAHWTGVTAYDDRLVGYAHIRWSDEDRPPRAAVELVVDPDHRASGLPERLVDRVRSVVADAGGGVVHLWVHRVADPSDTAAARAGWRVERELGLMTAELASRPEVPPLDGVDIRAYRPGVDDDAFLAVNNAAFAGHPEQGGWDTADLAERRRRDWFDPRGLLLAWRGDELLGFHWTKVHPGDEPVGEVYVLGIGPAAQGLGLGGALLAAGLAHLYDGGCRRVILYVDLASRPAVRLYEASGFRVVHREVCYADTVPAAERLPG